MSVAVLPPMSQAEALPRKKFTRTEVERMLELGLFDGQRFELIDGDLIDKMGQHPPHAYVIQRLLKWLASIFDAELVRIQQSMNASGIDRERSVPEPDVAVLAELTPELVHRHPRGDELLLVVEVADSTVRSDSTVKRDLYARAAVREYWVVDIQGRRVIVHRKPAEGVYAEITVRAEYETVSIESQPGSAVAVGEILP